MSTRVGIEKIRVYPSSMALPMPALCAARDHDPSDISDVMMIDERGVNPPWEDPITMAVNAALPMLTEQDKEDIELLLVASESGVDQEKPMSTWIQRYCGITPKCRNVEVKHACYGGTAAMWMAAGAIASGVVRKGKKAMVVCTDQSRMHLYKPWEFVKGCGATAFIVSADPKLFELEIGKSGVHTNEVSDLTRPTSRVETGNSEVSLVSYIDGLNCALENYLERLGEPISYDYFKKNIYHAPFGGMTLRATRMALKQFGSFKKSEADAIWAAKTKESISYVRRMGGTYAGSQFIQLTTLLDRANDLQPGDRIGMFSYGSGSCAEWYSGLVGPEAKAVAKAANLEAQLDARYRCSVREYEDAERERTAYIDCGEFKPSTDGFGDLYEKQYRGQNRLVFRGIQDHFRQYGWS